MNPYYQDELTTIYLGDCLEVMSQLPECSVDLIPTSPPYNSRINYDSNDDQLPWPLYYEWLGAVIKGACRLLVLGGTIAINVPLVIRWQRDHRFNKSWAGYDPTYKNHVGSVKTQGKGRVEPLGFRIFDMLAREDSHVREPVVWVKGSAGNAICTTHAMGCDSDPYFRPAYEMILIGSKGRWFHRGGTGRRGSEAMPFTDETKDVWFVPPVSNRGHPAVFPDAIPSRLIQLFTHAKDAVVLDPFLGKGTTCYCAKKLGRRSIGIEIAERYCELAAKLCSQTESGSFGNLTGGSS